MSEEDYIALNFNCSAVQNSFFLDCLALKNKLTTTLRKVDSHSSKDIASCSRDR